MLDKKHLEGVSILTYTDFLELIDNMANYISERKDMKQLDYVIKKIFLNFTVQGKKVVDITLNSPFDVLDTLKVSLGGPLGWLSELVRYSDAVKISIGELEGLVNIKLS